MGWESPFSSALFKYQTRLLINKVDPEAILQQPYADPVLALKMHFNKLPKKFQKKILPMGGSILTSDETDA